ncbi:hypothetical protein Vadar_010417 [Vaccinium darrowii]|uniref:Uncharacterized protein n=1 Tax=Vaccinium darrowii TaxID=229202 RepID=A0ACB7ZIS0_9ERIC|nr:hypothetical protein Vadar_010417 [Vaccinium darrowii]
MMLDFSVKSAYEKWEMIKFIEDLGLSSIWKNLAPPKVECFVWLAIQESIASKSVLARRSIISEDQNLCPLCNVNSESPNHLLLYCDKSWSVASPVSMLLLGRFGVGEMILYLETRLSFRMTLTICQKREWHFGLRR